MVSLRKGDTVRLEKPGGDTLTQVAMGLGWDVRRRRGLLGMLGARGEDIDLDASCLMFDAARQAIDSIWYRQLRSKDGSVVHSGDNLTGAGDGDDETIRVDLTRVPANVRTLMFTVSSFRGDTFDRIENAYCRLVDLVTGREVARYDLSGSGPHTGQIMASLRRTGSGTGGGWELTALGERTAGRTFHDMMPAILGQLA